MMEAYVRNVQYDALKKLQPARNEPVYSCAKLLQIITTLTSQDIFPSNHLQNRAQSI